MSRCFRSRWASVLALQRYTGGTGASLLKGWAGTSEAFETLIPTNSLDNILGKRFDGRRLLVIIDVEGAELAVIKGARRHLSMAPRPIWMVEVAVTEHLPSGLGVNPNLLATFQAFWEAGYVALKLDPRSPLAIVGEEEIMAAQKGSRSALETCNNFLFMDADRCKQIREICFQIVRKARVFTAACASADGAEI